MITDLSRLPDDSESAFVRCDCMDLMARYPDGYFDLAIVDPPFGINIGHAHGENIKVFEGAASNLAKQKFYHPFDDSTIPGGGYFKELFRVSKAQIIFGGNFFLDYLGAASCIIVWDKGRRGMDQADCEIAWTSLPGQSRVIEYKWNGMLQQDMKNKEYRIHPTQKPVQLYKWLIDRYTKPTDVILDTHVGSASSLIAAQMLNRRFVGCELDEYYYNQALERFRAETSQLTMFNLFGGNI